MKFLHELSLRTKLVLVSIVPLAGLLFYLQMTVQRDLLSAETARQIITDVETINMISNVLNEIQEERALLLLYMAGKTTETQQRMAEQYRATKASIESLDKFLKLHDSSIAEYQVMDSLAFIRGQVHANGEGEAANRYYTRLKSVLLNGVANTILSSRNVRLQNHMIDHLFLLYATEFMAQMKSELGAVLLIQKFSPQAYGNFVLIKGKFEIDFNRFSVNASEELRQLITGKLRRPLVGDARTIINEAFRNRELTDFPYDYDIWWTASTATIDALREVEQASAELITEGAVREMQLAERRLISNISIALLIAVLMVSLVVFTLRSILSSLRSIKTVADRMAKGDVSGEPLSVRSSDEIGALAGSFNEMIQATRKFSDAAEIIGKGDYAAVVEMRGPADSLAIALRNMKENLRKLSADNHHRTWLLTGNGRVNDAMRGEKDIDALGEAVVLQLVSHLNAKIAAIYLPRATHLELAGSYAYDFKPDITTRVPLNQGLLGQALNEKNIIVFNSLPPGYIQINSGLGRAVPQSLVIAPFVLEGQVKAILEIGAVEEFSDAHIEFLKMVSENIAIAFDAAQSRLTMKQLLDTTQRQAEELEAQQEELRQSNEELQANAALLERSESVLKGQHEELQQANEELEEKANMLEEQTDQLRRAKAEIEKKAHDLAMTSKYKSEFLANMSHELRTPLNSILILSKLLAENKNNVLGTKEVEFCTNIHNSGSDLLQLINEILDLSKVEAGKMDLQIEEVSLSGIKSTLESIFNELAREKSIDFGVYLHVALQDGRIMTDGQRLGQVLRNLLANAIKFTGEHGTVKLQIEPATMDTRFKNPAMFDAPDIVAFRVVDNGVGIPASKLDVIFDAFQQADGSTKRKYGGTGLGLSISRELTQLMGGELSVTSEPGKGSEFTLYLPMRLDHAKEGTEGQGGQSAAHSTRVYETDTQAVDHATAAQEALATEDDRHMISAGDKVILIVEDDKIFSKLLADLCRAKQFKCIMTPSGIEGLSLARHYKPDAILLDLKLPVLDGKEVLRRLKNDPVLRHVPVQIISGYDHRKETLALGAFDFLSKPVAEKDVRRALDKIGDFLRRRVKRLLIIEDDANQNSAIKALIGNGDVQSTCVFSGQEALSMLAAEVFDCVIVDLGLPDMSGFALLERIKGDERLRKMPVIVYTGKALDKAEHQTLTRFADSIVLKTADSHERLLDEAMLFLHRIEGNLPGEKQQAIRKLHKSDEVLNNRKVLLVDDDVRNIYALTNVLEEQGVRCLTAENGRVALEVMKANPGVEMVLMDVMMPEMDGYETTRAIRSEESFKAIPIIALTAKAMKGDREKCIQSGMSDYIPKPLNIPQLLSLMRIWLYK